MGLSNKTVNANSKCMREQGYSLEVLNTDKLLSVINSSSSLISDVIRLYDIDNLIHYIYCYMIPRKDLL